MRFDEVYRRLMKCQDDSKQYVVLLSETTLREVYSCIIASGAHDCLELGTGFGATACVMAAAVEENGGGLVTTVDHMHRTPIGVVELAEATGLNRYVNAVVHRRGYDWYLLGALREHTGKGVCEPCFDFCYLDGAHEWEPDALAALVMPKLLRPGAWLMMDDLNFRFREYPPDVARADWSDEELDIAHVGMVFDLLVKNHPDLAHFMLSNTGHIGWARKKGAPALDWRPDGVALAPVDMTWSESFDAAVLVSDSTRNADVSVAHGVGMCIRSTSIDPSVAIRSPLAQQRPIDYVTVRLRLEAPALETVQLFWIGATDEYFAEERSARCIVRAASGVQDLTFSLSGSTEARTIRLFRLDPADGACVAFLDRITLGSR
ncbi:MAG TPA: class I SAM-dependent methyltransferase [Acetobacteraceae bacterium]|nr:class I SAM-dependent methyltransferase [Acetobacteraceae bacterium]